MIKSLVSILFLALLSSACQNTLFIGEQHAFDLTVETKSDASEPVNFNFGYESHTTAVVPPKKPLGGNQTFSPRNVPSGDILSSVSAFRIERVKDGKVHLTMHAGVATGKAATALANQIRGTPGPQAAGADNSRRMRALSPPIRSEEAPAGVFKSMQDIIQR